MGTLVVAAGRLAWAKPHTILLRYVFGKVAAGSTVARPMYTWTELQGICGNKRQQKLCGWPIQRPIFFDLLPLNSYIVVNT